MIVKFSKTKDDYGWMSNMAGFYDGEPLRFEYNGKKWNSAENLFQAMRFEDKEVIRKISEQNGYNGKKVAKANKSKVIVEPMSVEDVVNMLNCLHIKVQKFPKLKQLLLDLPKDVIIIEDVSKRMGGNALFWGAAKVGDYWIGGNILGKCWSILKTYLHSLEYKDNSNFSSSIYLTVEQILDDLKDSIDF